MDHVDIEQILCESLHELELADYYLHVLDHLTDFLSVLHTGYDLQKTLRYGNQWLYRRAHLMADSRLVAFCLLAIQMPFSFLEPGKSIFYFIGSIKNGQSGGFPAFEVVWLHFYSHELIVGT